MKKGLAIFAMMALAFAPSMGWSAGMSDDANRDTTVGDPFELEFTGGGLTAPTVVDPVSTQEVFYVVRGADGVIYYTIRDICPDNSGACNTGQAMRALGSAEANAFAAVPPFPGGPVFTPIVNATQGLPIAPATTFVFGPSVGAASADFGGEFFAGTNIIGAQGFHTMGPGINGDPVLANMGDANADGWAGAAGQTPWVPLPTAQSADSDPAIHYVTAPYPNQWASTLVSPNAAIDQGPAPTYINLALFSDPIRSNTPISPFDIIIEVRGDNGTIYRTAYNLNAVLVPPATPTPALTNFSAGTGAAMAYIDRAFPPDVSGACNIGDGFPNCADRFNPITGFLVNDSGQQQSPWIAMAN